MNTELPQARPDSVRRCELVSHRTPPQSDGAPLQYSMREPQRQPLQYHSQPPESARPAHTNPHFPLNDHQTLTTTALTIYAPPSIREDMSATAAKSTNHPPHTLVTHVRRHHSPEYASPVPTRMAEPRPHTTRRAPHSDECIYTPTRHRLRHTRLKVRTEDQSFGDTSPITLSGANMIEVLTGNSRKFTPHAINIVILTIVIV